LTQATSNYLKQISKLAFNVQLFPNNTANKTTCHNLFSNLLTLQGAPSPEHLDPIIPDDPELSLRQDVSKNLRAGKNKQVMLRFKQHPIVTATDGQIFPLFPLNKPPANSFSVEPIPKEDFKLSTEDISEAIFSISDDDLAGISDIPMGMLKKLGEFDDGLQTLLDFSRAIMCTNTLDNHPELPKFRRTKLTTYRKSKDNLTKLRPIEIQDALPRFLNAAMVSLVTPIARSKLHPSDFSLQSSNFAVAKIQLKLEFGDELSGFDVSAAYNNTPASAAAKAWMDLDYPVMARALDVLGGSHEIVYKKTGLQMITHGLIQGHCLSPLGFAGYTTVSLQRARDLLQRCGDTIMYVDDGTTNTMQHLPRTAVEQLQQDKNKYLSSALPILPEHFRAEALRLIHINLQANNVHQFNRDLVRFELKRAGLDQDGAKEWHIASNDFTGGSKAMGIMITRNTALEQQYLRDQLAKTQTLIDFLLSILRDLKHPSYGRMAMYRIIVHCLIPKYTCVRRTSHWKHNLQPTTPDTHILLKWHDTHTHT
jgi:hypothetical protein